MAEGGQKLAEVLSELKRAAREGVSTKFLDEFAHELIKDRGAEPAFLNYRPTGAKQAYPFTLCASLNDTVIHGLPSADAILKTGDVLKLDIGLQYKGFYLDTAATVGIGTIVPEAKRLIKITEDALQKGIAEAKPGNTTDDVGRAIQIHIQKNEFFVIKGLIGHGIGRNLHEDPEVPNFDTRGNGTKLEAGMVIAIEPMAALGSGEVKQLKDDSFATRDGSTSTHFEHTVVITRTGPRILTRS